MESADFGFLGQFAEITLIDMVMSADNAVAIALACRSLPPGRHGIAFTLGALGAVTFRFAFASFVSVLLLVAIALFRSLQMRAFSSIQLASTLAQVTRRGRQVLDGVYPDRTAEAL